MANLALLFLLVQALLAGQATRAGVPGRYFQLMDEGIREAQQRLAAEPSLERRSHYLPGALLISAVLYAKDHPDNPRREDPGMLRLAEHTGDLLAGESERGEYTKRGDHHRDTYMWLEAYRLLRGELGQEREARWRRELEKLASALAASTADRENRPAYQSPFLGTSPNHYALWASTVYLAGRIFGNEGWERLGARVLHRFAAEEQAPDGYWGEHSNAGPTPGYDYLTTAGVALYWEHSQDPAALEALRRSLNFHEHYTYPDGQPVEVIGDRRRHMYVSPWGHFGFSNFPDGRRYAQFLTSFYRADALSMEHLGRVAQDALYFHDGSAAAIPPDLPRYAHRMSVPAGIRKSGPWMVCLSGLIATQAVTSRYYLDRQSSLSVFHEKTGLIITGANSKRQPELATFWEKVNGGIFHMPLSSRLRMSDEQDRLSLAYNTLFSELEVKAPSGGGLAFRFLMTRKGGFEEAQLNLQICLKAGDELETAGGRKVLLEGRKIVLEATDLGNWVRHHGWTLHVDGAARLTWPVYPFNPYANGPEKEIGNAVGVLSVPVRPGDGGTQEVAFRVKVGRD
jgi:hypothetical protein